MTQLLQNLVNIIIIVETVLKILKWWNKNHRGKWQNYPLPYGSHFKSLGGVVMTFSEILQLIAGICAVGILISYIVKWIKRK